LRTARRGGARTNGTPYAAAAVPAAPSIGATKIQISNLNHNVVQKDILELFSTVGKNSFFI
jgi:N-acetylmuramic acid 6-phosphate (MurNAc-6-P) etherase